MDIGKLVLASFGVDQKKIDELLGLINQIDERKIEAFALSLQQFVAAQKDMHEKINFIVSKYYEVENARQLMNAINGDLSQPS